MEKLIEKNIVVIKVGSSSLVNKGEIDMDLMKKIALQIQSLRKEYQFAIVTSGAIASGNLKLGSVNGGEVRKQVSAAVGQRPLLSAWGTAFDTQEIETGLFLFSETDLEKPTLPLLDALKAGVVPIINANDTVNTDEINKLSISADNDRLAAFAACYLLNASKLIFLTEKQGVLDVSGNRIREIDSLESLSRIGFFGKTDIGTGGMQSKVLEARRFITRGNRVAYIADASEDDVITKIVRGMDVGTKVTLPLQAYFNI